MGELGLAWGRGGVGGGGIFYVFPICFGMVPRPLGPLGPLVQGPCGPWDPYVIMFSKPFVTHSFCIVLLIVSPIELPIGLPSGSQAANLEGVCGCQAVYLEGAFGRSIPDLNWQPGPDAAKPVAAACVEAAVIVVQRACQVQ